MTNGQSSLMFQYQGHHRECRRRTEMRHTHTHQSLISLLRRRTDTHFPGHTSPRLLRLSPQDRAPGGHQSDDDDGERHDHKAYNPGNHAAAGFGLLRDRNGRGNQLVHGDYRPRSMWVTNRLRRRNKPYAKNKYFPKM